MNKISIRSQVKEIHCEVNQNLNLGPFFCSAAQLSANRQHYDRFNPLSARQLVDSGARWDLRLCGLCLLFYVMWTVWKCCLLLLVLVMFVYHTEFRV
jgi:hypothetical protein